MSTTLEVRNPATGELITILPAAGVAEVAEATGQAAKTFDSGVWSRAQPRERAAVLLRLAELVERDAETLARLDSEDAGKPITECRTGDVPGAIESVRWFAEAADKVFGRVAPTGPDHLGVDDMITAAFLASGQNCTAGSLIPGAPGRCGRGGGAVHGRRTRARDR